MDNLRNFLMSGYIVDTDKHRLVREALDYIKRLEFIKIQTNRTKHVNGIIISSRGMEAKYCAIKFFDELNMKPRNEWDAKTMTIIFNCDSPEVSISFYISVQFAIGEIGEWEKRNKTREDWPWILIADSESACFRRPQAILPKGTYHHIYRIKKEDTVGRLTKRAL